MRRRDFVELLERLGELTSQQKAVVIRHLGDRQDSMGRRVAGADALPPLPSTAGARGLLGPEPWAQALPVQGLWPDIQRLDGYALGAFAQAGAMGALRAGPD